MKMKMMKIFSVAAFVAVFFTGCDVTKAAFEANTTESGVISSDEAYGVIKEDPKYQECYDIPDPVPPYCADQPSSDIVLARDLLDYMYARTDEQPYLFSMFMETSQIISLSDANRTSGTGTVLPPPVLTDLDRKVSCISFEGDVRAVNIDKFKCLVRKFADG